METRETHRLWLSFERCVSFADKWDFDRVETFGATNDNELVAFSVSVDKVGKFLQIEDCGILLTRLHSLPAQISISQETPMKSPVLIFCDLGLQD